MQSGELQRRVSSDGDWLARLRGRGKEGSSVEEHSWVGSGGPTMAGHGMRGAVVGWYLPVLVVDEKNLNRNGVKVVVMMRRQAVEDTEWRRRIKGQWSGGQWNRLVGQRGWREIRCMTGVEQCQRFGRRGALAAPCYVWSHFILLPFN